MTYRYVARYRFFVVPGVGPALLGMPDIELLGILKIMCEVVQDQQTDRKSDIMDVFSKSQHTRLFQVQHNKEADKKASQLITQKVQQILVIYSLVWGALRAPLNSGERGQSSVPGPMQWVAYVL